MSTWRPKEKELTPEEALIAAKKELAKFWMTTDPLFAGVSQDDKTYIVPIDPSFENRDWFFYLSDPAQLTSEEDFRYFQELRSRYEEHNLTFLYVLQPRTAFFKERENIEALLRRFNLLLPTVIDADGKIGVALDWKTEDHSHPKVALISRKSRVAQWSGPHWKEGLEKGIQDFLRKKDPGLPLESPVVFPTFKLEESRTWFRGKTEIDFEEEGIVFGGVWRREEDRFVTQDPKAFIEFPIKSPEVSVLAYPTGKPTHFAKVLVEFDRSPVPGSKVGPDLTADDEGGTVFQLKEWRHNHVLTDLTKSGTVVLKFPWADKSNIAVYAFSGWRTIQRT